MFRLFNLVLLQIQPLYYTIQYSHFLQKISFSIKKQTSITNVVWSPVVTTRTVVCSFMGRGGYPFVYFTAPECDCVKERWPFMLTPHSWGGRDKWSAALDIGTDRCYSVPSLEKHLSHKKSDWTRNKSILNWKSKCSPKTSMGRIYCYKHMSFNQVSKKEVKYYNADVSFNQVLKKWIQVTKYS